MERNKSGARETAATRFVSCLGTCYSPRHTGNPTLVSQITRERRKGRKWTKREIVCVPPCKTTVFPGSEKRRRITSRNRLTRVPRDVGEGRQSNIVSREVEDREETETEMGGKERKTMLSSSFLRSFSRFAVARKEKLQEDRAAARERTV